MLNKPSIFFILILSFFGEFSLAQSIETKINIPVDFAEKSFNHVVNISNVGVHSAGTSEEKEVAEYIYTEFSNSGIETSIEKFEFESFDVTNIDLEINKRKLQVLQICFNPYMGNFHFQDNFTLLDSDNSTSESIKDKIVVAAFPLENSKYFQLFYNEPKLILVIPAVEFQKLKKESTRELNCTIRGELNTHTSQNVVAKLLGEQNEKEEIILSAHYDSYPGSVGADDNASGVGVLIELAKFFKKNPTNINLKFVAFGGEEKGLLGSRAYLNRHSNELTNCRLLFNLDQLGGEYIFIETTGGVEGISQIKGKTQFPEFMRNRSLEGIESNWRLLAPEVLPVFEISNRPDWLTAIIKESTSKPSISVSYAGNTGSDQMTFAQAGIVASAIGTSGNDVHSAKDIPSQVNKKSLFDCGKIVTEIVLKTAVR